MMKNVEQTGPAGRADGAVHADKLKARHAGTMDDAHHVAAPGGTGWAWFEGMSFMGDEDDVSEKETSAVLPQNGASGRKRSEVCRDGVWQRVLGQAGGADGAEICAQLRAMTLERALGANASQQAIWMLEGQRALVLQMLRRAGVAVHGR